MRIISKFHDYYDCVQAYGQDDKLVYIRNTTEPEPLKFNVELLEQYQNPKISRKTPVLSIPHHLFRWRERWGRYCKTPAVDPYLVGFCGKVYPVLVFGGSEKKTVCFSLEEVDSYLAEWCNQKQFDEYTNPPRSRFGPKYKYWSSTYSRNRFQKFFGLSAFEDSFKDLFVQTRNPIFVIESKEIYEKVFRDIFYISYNVKLSDFQWYRKFDTATAFQEISMFLGSLASPEKPIPAIADKIMVGAKGFDKWSFRKEPSS